MVKLAVSYAYDKMDLIESILIETKNGKLRNPIKVNLAIEYVKQFKVEIAKNEKSKN